MLVLKMPVGRVPRWHARGRSLKTAIKQFIGALGRIPFVSAWLERPAVYRWIRRLPAAKLLVPTGWDRKHPFDRAYGTDTSGVIPISELSLGEADSAHANDYGGSQPSIVRYSLAILPPLDTFKFIDLGCGKGRVLIVASEFPFIDIVGVELSPVLVGIARANAKIVSLNFPTRTGIRVVESDAGSYVFPAGNLVLYLYNPFSEPVLSRVVRALEAAIAAHTLRRVYVVSYNPVMGRCFDTSPAFRRHSAHYVPYAEDEMGFGPDESDVVVIWQDVGQTESQAGCNARIVVEPSGRRVSLQAAPEDAAHHTRQRP